MNKSVQLIAAFLVILVVAGCKNRSIPVQSNDAPNNKERSNIMEHDEVLERLKKTRLILSNGGPQDKPIFPLDFGLHTPEDSVEAGHTDEREDRKVIPLSKETFYSIITKYNKLIKERTPPHHTVGKLYSFGTVIGELKVDDCGSAYVLSPQLATELLQFICMQLGSEKPACETVRQFAKRLNLNMSK